MSVTNYLQSKEEYISPDEITELPNQEERIVDFQDVLGQDALVEYIVAAAAGGHNILMIGTPGCGKSMIAKRIATVLPPLVEEEALETTCIYSVAGLLKTSSQLITERPFRASHHNASTNSLIGGGSPVVPGEIALAPMGCFFWTSLRNLLRKPWMPYGSSWKIRQLLFPG